MSKKVKKLFADLIIFLISLLVAYLLVQSGILETFIAKVGPVKYLAEFVSGMLFTSFITTPFSFALFYVLSESVHPFQVALIGGLGACLGDMLIVTIFRNSFFDDFKTAERKLKLRKTFSFFHNPYFSQIAPLLGVLIIASPFPDELGLMMLGASRLKLAQLFLLVFASNAAGIYFISLAARNI